MTQSSVLLSGKQNLKKFTQTLLVNWIDPENTSSMSDQKIKFVGTEEDMKEIKKREV